MRKATYCLLVLLMLVAPAAAVAAPAQVEALADRVDVLEARLDSESEARDRQADAFDAAISRVEIVNGALAIGLALSGIAVGLLAFRWVRRYAEETVEQEVKTTLQDQGNQIFTSEATDLRDAYEQQFADLYRRFKRAVEAAE